MLEVRDVRKSFGGFQAVDGVSFTVPTGSISAIIGPNGAGKTTLFNLITGHVKPDTGRVVFKKRDVTGIAPHDLCRIGMGRSFQRTNIFPRLTVYENIQAAYLSHRGRGWNLFTPVDRLYREESLALLDAVGLLDKAGEVSGFLSHGNQKQLELGWRWRSSRRSCSSTSRRPACRPPRRASPSGSSRASRASGA
jgi:branched-chain amino acid transport system ATP-binding protein